MPKAPGPASCRSPGRGGCMRRTPRPTGRDRLPSATGVKARKETEDLDGSGMMQVLVAPHRAARPGLGAIADARRRSEEHTSELQSLMRISDAVFCLKKKKKRK